jgi:hypothetical protein
MIDIKKRITVIEELVAKGTVQSLTYAALECRLTIEQICYERLLISHDYISLADLRKWTPAQVVKQISEEANDLVDSGFTLSISKEPIQEGREPKTQDDYESFNYVQVGQQVGFKISRLSSLWNGLSKIALHIDVPKVKESLSIYGDLESIKAKVTEAVAEFKNFEQGNMISSAFGEEFHFRCDDCDALIKRKVALVKDGQVISCVNPSCDESYTLHRQGDEIEYSRKTLTIVCRHCTNEISFPAKKAESLRYGQTLSFVCECCKNSTLVRLLIAQEVTITPEEAR